MTRPRMVLPNGKVFVMGPESDAAYVSGGFIGLMVFLAQKGIDLETAPKRLP